jgi:hypothetical protein
MNIEEYKLKQSGLLEFVVSPTTAYNDKMIAIGITVFVAFAAMLALAGDAAAQAEKARKNAHNQ